MIVECPACNTIFPVDPKKVPTGGIDARCSVCSEVFFVAPPEPEAEVSQPEVGAIEPEVEISEAFTDEPSVEVSMDDPVEDPPVEIVEVDEGFAEVDKVGVEAEPDPDFHGEPSAPAEPDSETAAGTEIESEPGLEVETEPEAAFEIEREPSFEEREVSFNAELDATGEDLADPVFSPEPSLETEPVFESAEATFEKVEGTVLEPAEAIQEEAVEAVEDISSEVETETVEFVEEVAETAESVKEVAEAVEEVPPEGPTISAPVFGKRDPTEKAQRLARVLVSDIILYNPDRHHTATETGRVKEEFEEEIQKSWSEYVEQVGDEVANTTPYFNDALNEILAKGDTIF